MYFLFIYSTNWRFR